MVNKEAKVSNVAALNAGTYAGGDMTTSDTMCIYQNSNPSYAVTITSANGAFEVDDGFGNTIAYTLTWDDVGDGSNATAVTYNTALTGRSTQNNNTDDDCSTHGGDNVEIENTFLAVNISSVPNGTYTDELTILIEPDF